MAHRSKSRDSPTYFSYEVISLSKEYNSLFAQHKQTLYATNDGPLSFINYIRLILLPRSHPLVLVTPVSPNKLVSALLSCYFGCGFDVTDLDESFGSLKEMLLPLRLTSLRMPVYDSLLSDTISVVQHFEDLRESLDDPCILVTMYLNDVDQGYLSLGALTERFNDWCIFLFIVENGIWM